MYMYLAAACGRVCVCFGCARVLDVLVHVVCWDLDAAHKKYGWSLCYMVFHCAQTGFQNPGSHQLQNKHISTPTHRQEAAKTRGCRNPTTKPHSRHMRKPRTKVLCTDTTFSFLHIDMCTCEGSARDALLQQQRFTAPHQQISIVQQILQPTLPPQSARTTLELRTLSDRPDLYLTGHHCRPYNLHSIHNLAVIAGHAHCCEAAAGGCHTQIPVPVLCSKHYVVWQRRGKGVCETSSSMACQDVNGCWRVVYGLHRWLAV